MKLKSLFATVAAVAALASGAATAQTTLRAASIAPTTSPWGQWALQTAEAIKEASDGQLIVEIIQDAQLGDE